MSAPFVALMRRYCVDYTARHDLSVCDQIMSPGYTLHMGGHDVAGRDKAYKPAAAAQFGQFPGLMLTVNQIACSGDRLVLSFTEHGASSRHGAVAAWAGIGLYRWDGERLIENFVEQDYFGRRRQLRTGNPDPVGRPALAPWDTPSVPPNPAREHLVRDWLHTTDPASQPCIEVDDAPAGHQTAPLIDVDEIEIDDLFSVGGLVAFHAVQVGFATSGEPDFAPYETLSARLHIVGLVETSGEEVLGGRVIRDRLGLHKRLTAQAENKPAYKPQAAFTSIGNEELWP